MYNMHAGQVIATSTIYRLLPTRYHYKLHVTSNDQIYPGLLFMFGTLPKHPTWVISNPKLTKVHCRIMFARHMYQESNFKGVGACFHCNINKTITWTHAKEHKTTLENIWLAPGFASKQPNLKSA